MGRHKKRPPPPPTKPLAPEGKGKKRTPQSSFDPVAGKDVYEPEAIVAKRTAKGVMQWQVKWVGYDNEANTWEPIEHLAGCEDMIAEFEEAERKKNEATLAAEKALKERKKKEEEQKRQAAIRDSAARLNAGEETGGDSETAPITLDDDQQQGRTSATNKVYKDRPSKRTSEVWSCFTEKGAKAKHALCTLPSRDKYETVCNEEISHAAGTTSLWNHIMWHHPDDYIKLNKEKASKSGWTSQAAGSGVLGTQGLPSGVPAQLPRMPASKRDELHKAHARWLTKKKRPLTVVEDEEYRDMWRVATNGTYQPPDRTTLRSFVLELSKEGQDRVRQVNEALRQDHRLPSIGGDIWSSKNHSISLLGMTQYHINSNWEIEELLLAADPFSRESHTGDAITSHTAACLKEMGYPDDIYSGVFKKTSDNGSNIAKGWKGFDGGFCVDHTCQLSLGVFIEHPEISPTVKKEKGMTTHFHQSTGVDGLGGLTKCQQELKLPKRHPVQGCATRWSSWGEMLEFYRLEQRAVQLYDIRHSRKAGAAYRENQMDLNDWRINEQACAVVQKVNDWVQYMEGTKTYPTLPMVLPTMYNLINDLRPDAPLICDFQGEDTYQLLPCEMHPGVLKARNELHADLVARFITNLDLNAKRQYAISTLLHPAFKEYIFPGASDAEKTWAMRELRTEWRTHWKNLKAKKKGANSTDEADAHGEHVPPHPNPTATNPGAAAAPTHQRPQQGEQQTNDPPEPDDDSSSPLVIKKRRTISISALMGGALTGVGMTREQDMEKDQLDEYLKEPRVANLDLNVLAYWRAKEFQWPELARMVKQYFAAPATSAGVERVFSAAGRMHDDMRKAMKEGTLKHSLFAAQNTK